VFNSPEFGEGKVSADQHFLGIRDDVDRVFQIEMVVTPKFARRPSARLHFVNEERSAVLIINSQFYIFHVV
jgi:hypothetical protein